MTLHIIIFMTLKKVRKLCRILGSDIVKSAVGVDQMCVVLVPNMVDIYDLEVNVFPKLIDQQVFPRDSKLGTDCRQETYRSSKVKFVYFSWLFDSITANEMAPFRPHCIGYIE
jgi:hypothetical protein